jgi:hypothetical protein
VAYLVRRVGDMLLDLDHAKPVLRQNLYQAQDEVDARKEKLIDEIEARLKQKITKDRLFLVRWKIV